MHIKKVKLLYLGLAVIAIPFLYFLITGIYFAYRDNPDQDKCSFNTVSNSDYLKIQNSMTYGIDDLIRDFEQVKDSRPNRNLSFGLVLKGSLENNLEGIDDFYESLATTHAFMRKIGFSNFENGGMKWSAHLTDRMHYTYHLQYKIISAKFDWFDVWGFVTRAPSTISIQLETDQYYQNTKLLNLSGYYSHFNHLSSLPHNFNQSSACPLELTINNQGFSYNLK